VQHVGWTKASLLQPGDKVVCADDTLATIEDIFDTGEWETVYNLRIKKKGGHLK